MINYPCIICGKQSILKFVKKSKVGFIDYFECLGCGHLSAMEFSEGNLYNDKEYFQQIDKGWENRNNKIYKFIKLLSFLPGIKICKKSIILDYGCGRGNLVKKLVGDGFSALGYEPNIQSIFAPNLIISNDITLKKKLTKIHLIALIEVLEHLRQPDQVLEKTSNLVTPNGYIIVSTEIYEKRKHNQDWTYLNPDAGHISVFSEISLRAFMSKYSFYPIVRINDQVWIFRRTSQKKIKYIEFLYFVLSMIRIKLKNIM